MTNLIGQNHGPYRIMEQVGRGGMATVYYGRDVSLQRPVAIKVIDKRYRNDPAYTIRFVNEARMMAKWRHENLIQIY
jgi:serine/threonine-protein kinase